MVYLVLLILGVNILGANMLGLDIDNLIRSMRSGIVSNANLVGRGARGPIPAPLQNMVAKPDYWEGLPGAVSWTSAASQLNRPTTRLPGLGGTPTPTATPFAANTPKPTQVATSQPTPAPQPTTQPASNGLNDALDLAERMFGPEAAKVLATTIAIEGGWDARPGDRGQSFGPLQFYGGGGQLNNFAQATQMPLAQAGPYVAANPLEAVRWALNNYYGNALRAGMDQGLRGPELAEYVQMEGQRSDRRLTAGKARSTYRSMYGE